MNARRPGLAQEAKCFVDKAAREEAIFMGVYCAEEYLEDCRRVQSIVNDMAHYLRFEIKQANDRDTSIETTTPELFMENLLWLFDVLETKASTFGDRVEKARLAISPQSGAGAEVQQ